MRQRLLLHRSLITLVVACASLFTFCFLQRRSMTARKQREAFLSSLYMHACRSTMCGFIIFIVCHHTGCFWPAAERPLSSKFSNQSTVFAQNSLSSEGEKQMPLSIVCLVFCTSIAAAVQVPFLSNITLVPKSSATSITLTDRSCDQCLCESNFSHSILNCFLNNTCQLFVDAPLTYTLKPTLNANVYFPRQILPDASQCCMSNTTDLLQRLSNATSTYAPVNHPRCVVIDNHGYLVTVSHTDQSIVRFYPNNLTRVDPSPSSLFSDSPLALAYHDGAYYVAFDYAILVFNSSNMTLINSISASALNGTRDMIFVNEGQQMIVTVVFSSRLLFFNRSSPTSHNYTFSGYQDLTFQGPHGLFYVNDGLFYLTSYSSGNVYKYSNAGNGTAWSGSLAVNASSVGTSLHGNHVTIDACDRYWLSAGGAGVRLFDREGFLVGSLYATGSNIFDTLMLDNYVMYLSDKEENRIIRLDPKIQC